jgi:DNA-binding ferritin-like protein (Dps family)
MKTIVLKKSELDKFPGEVQELIKKTIETRTNDLKDLKERIKKLPFQKITYRTDTNEISKEEKSPNFIIDCWHKTAGEQWGNAAGNEYTFRIGSKYIRLYIYFSGTNLTSQYYNFQISFSKMEEIIDLFEEVYNCNDETDKLSLLEIAISRVEKLDSPY